MEPASGLSSKTPKPPPKRFFRKQVPDSILNNPSLNKAISLLPSNYNFEIHKSIWRIISSGAKRVALQFPEGLLMYSLVLCDIFETFASVEECFILGDVTYGACCVDDFSASALNADLLIHYGHSCLVPIDYTKIPALYVFVEIKIDLDHLLNTIKANFSHKKIAVAGTIQFSAAVRAVKSALADFEIDVIVPQSKPLSSGEILGCTSPTVPKSAAVDAVVFVADGRFHLEAFMIANPHIRAFRYDPYLKVLFLEEYDHNGMKEARKKAILNARKAKSWGVVLGTLGRQGNPRILDRLQKRMVEKSFDWTIVLMSELSPARISLFGDSVDAWVQIACPRLSIDWGEAFGKPLLTPFEAEIALGFLPGWWEKGFDCKTTTDIKSEGAVGGPKASCSNCHCTSGSIHDVERKTDATDYPMDYYAQDGGDWNCSYAKSSALQRKPRPSRPAVIS
ncbi:hypothetical protein H6P81_012926 [Aristolochia fimbriata]|uniref:2-(3-amino-3-carboxypropyl)histidine synthase subunit 1 n=1 Tax=Aristolochia fimbriata TaxID=158543 RepID=A0AAV7ED95_ARIFI|nr:hypothetical protein H6P81_012926 [Aristolochia fimbriata]